MTAAEELIKELKKLAISRGYRIVDMTLKPLPKSEVKVVTNETSTTN